MTRARASLPLLLTAIVPLAVAACETQRKPLRGFDKPPPGSIVLDSEAPGGGAVMLWPMFDLPLEPQQIFRPRLGGQDAVYITSQEDGFYDYAEVSLQGWTAGWTRGLGGVPPGTYIVELVDDSGQSWGQSAPLAIPASADIYSGVQIPGVVFAHFDGKVASWNIDPALQDAEPATDEITVTSMVAADVVVERCLIASGSPTSCTPVGTVAPGADLHTVETVTGSSEEDHQALLIRLASDASQAYQRDLVEWSGHYGSTNCQIERIIVHGKRSQERSTPNGTPGIAMSSCYGYRSSSM